MGNSNWGRTVTPMAQELQTATKRITARISRHLSDVSNGFCNMWLTQGSRMYSDLIMAHSVVHEREQWASIPPQKAELQNSFFHAEADDTVCVICRSQPSRKDFCYNKWEKPDVRDIVFGHTVLTAVMERFWIKAKMGEWVMETCTIWACVGIFKCGNFCVFCKAKDRKVTFKLHVLRCGEAQKRTIY